MQTVGTHRARGSKGLSGGAPSISRCKPNRRTQMVTRNDESVTRHLPGLDQRDRRPGAPAGADGNIERRQAPGMAAMNLEFHALATLFPLLDGAGFDELVSDIRVHG